MNLAQIVGPVTGMVNPRVPATLQSNTGYRTSASGKRSPSYDLPQVDVTAQVLELSTRDLRQLDGLNISGSSRKIYLYGQVNATVRVNRQGGDLITLQDGSVYLTTAVLEQWPDWVCCAATLQNGS